MNSSNNKVLLVDDDPAIRRIMAAWLKKAGYHVAQAEDGRQALASLETGCPDFLITDWEMPRLDGLKLCGQVRQLDLPNYVYIVICTARMGSGNVVSALKAGADDFLTKPIKEDELLARMLAGARVLEFERRLSDLARTDPLTGLMTRRSFYEIFQKEWHRTGRLQLPLSCVILDLDFFKRINDVYGHAAGDAVLKATATALVDHSRASDSVCRFGGEEFAVLLPETSEHDAALWAERVRKRLAALTIPFNGKDLRITGSFGTTQKHDDTRTPEQLIDQADEALLCAKQSGRDRVVRFESLGSGDNPDRERADKIKSLFHGVTAAHVMTPIVACLREKEAVGQAAEFFLHSRLSSTPVVDGTGKLVGILSEKDLMAAMVSPKSWSRPVRDLMKPNVICYEENSPIRTIHEFLCRVSINRVVIVNNGRPTGIIGRGTLLRWFRNLILTEGLLEPADLPSEALDPDPCRSRKRLAETASELARQASELQGRFGENTDDLIPYVVGGATRIQELVNDLLACSHDANETGTGGSESLHPEVGHAD